MPSFGEGFANAFNQGLAVTNQRDAGARQFITAERDRKQRLELTREKAEAQALANRQKQAQAFVTQFTSVRDKELTRLQNLAKTPGGIPAAQKALAALKAQSSAPQKFANALFEKGLLPALPDLEGPIDRAFLSTEAERNKALKAEAQAKDTALVTLTGQDPRTKRPVTITVPRNQAEPLITKLGFIEASAIKEAKEPPFLEGGKVKGADSRRLEAMFATSFGATINETGNVIGLRPEFAKRMPGLVQAAEKKLQTGEADSLGDAVTQVLADSAVSATPLPAQPTFMQLADDIEANAELELRDEPEQAEDKLRVEDATGIGSGIKDFFLNTLFGQVFSDITDPDVVRSRQELALLANDFVVAHKRSPRLPVWEQARLARIFNEPAVWRNPEVVRVQLDDWDKRLTRDIAQERNFLLVPGAGFDKREIFENIRTMARLRTRIRRFRTKDQTEGILDFTTKKVNEELPETIDFKDLPERR